MKTRATTLLIGIGTTLALIAPVTHAATNTRYGFKQEIIRAYGLR